MMPPTFDPTDSEVTAITAPDGSEVQEVRDPDGNVVFSAGGAIPDSAVAQFDATQLTGFLNDDVIDPFSDNIGTNNLAAVSDPLYKTGDQNGNPVSRYDGTDDAHSTSSFSVSQPFTLLAVVVSSGGSSTEAIFGRSDANQNSVYLRSKNGTWQLYAGNQLEGTSTAPPLILGAVFDGSNSAIRENGTETTGSAGTLSYDSLCLGATDGGAAWPLNGDIGEAVVYDSDLSATGDLSAEEQRLADKWGITLS